MKIIRIAVAPRGARPLASARVASALIPVATISPPTIVATPTTVPTPIDRAASSVTVMTAAEIERAQRRTVPDALRTVG